MTSHARRRGWVLIGLAVITLLVWQLQQAEQVEFGDSHLVARPAPHTPRAERRRSTPPESHPTVSIEASTPRPRPTLRVLVRDLFTTEPVRRLPFVLTTAASAAIPLETGDDGILEIPEPGSVIQLIPSAAGWGLARDWEGVARAREELWVFATRIVRGRVDFAANAPEPGPASARVNWFWVDYEVSARSGKPDWIEGETWLREKGVLRSSDSRVNADGTFQLSIPAARGLWVRADCDRFASSSASVPLEDDEIVLTLRPHAVLRGVVVDTDGNPVPKAPTQCVVVLVGGPEERPPGEVRSQSRGYTWRTDRASGRTITQCKEGGSAGDDGRFELSSPMAGHTFIAVQVPGYAPGRVDLGDVAGSVEDVRVVLTRREAGLLQLRDGDARAAAGTRVQLLDVTDAEAQILSGSIVADAEGRVRTEWFEDGRTYAVRVRDAAKNRLVAAGFLEWRSQSELDIRRLSTSPSRTVR